jgi:hypothetical protein
LWFADASGNDLTSPLQVTPGGTFDVSIYMSQNLPAGKKGIMFSAAVGIDRSSSQGTSSPIDQKITLAHGDHTVDVVWGTNWNADYPIKTVSPEDGEGMVGFGNRPWGYELICEEPIDSSGVENFSNRHLATLHLSNNLEYGETYDIKLWDNGFSDSGTTFLLDADGLLYHGVGDVLSILAVPEPLSMMIFGGMLVPILLRRNRR